MATATKNSRTAGRPRRRTSDVRPPSSLEFLIYEDNGGSHHWTIVDALGEGLVQSGSFPSYDEAERAARVIRDGAGSARFKRRVDDRPLDLAARRDAAAEDNSDAERWLDEGGSFNSEAVTKWPAER